MRQDDKYTQTFLSYRDAVDEVLSPKPETAQQYTTSHDAGTRENGEFRFWQGTESWESTIPLLDLGWQDGVDRIESRALAVTRRVQRLEVKRTRVMKEHGPGRASVTRALSGNPRPYHGTKMLPQPTRAIKILVNLSASAGVSTTAIFDRGAAIVALLRALERAGRPVELWVGGAVNSFGGRAWQTVIKVKASNQRVSPSLMAFTAHPAFFRRFLFALWERIPKSELELGWGYGRPAEFTADVTKDFDIVSEQMTYGGVFDAKWVTSMLERMGVNVNV